MVRVCGFVCALILFKTVLSVCGAPTYTLDFTIATNRRFDGIGALSGGGGTSRLLFNYPEPQRSDILDILFKPNSGSSLHILKVEIGGDAQSTEATEASHMHTRDDLNYHRGYEWWLLSEAKKRNPSILTYGLSWGAPGWVGNGKYYSQDGLDYHIKWIQGAKSVYGITIDYVGIWNEKQYNVTWIKLYRKALDDAGFTTTKIIAADDAGWDICESMLQDPELYNIVYAAGSHYPYWGNKFAPQQFQTTGKPMWASECWDLNVVGDWHGASRLAQMLNGNYVKGNMTAAVIWNLIYSWWSILPYSRTTPGVGGTGHSLMFAAEPWTGHYSIQPPIYVVAHTTQFAKPGWQYVATSTAGVLSGGGTYVALTDGSDWSLIFETIEATSSQDVVFKLNGASKAVNSVALWKTNQTSWFQEQERVAVVGGVFRLTLQPDTVYSVTTTSGQGRASTGTIVPSSKPFPFPYAEDFESYQPEQTVLYFEDEGGSFNAASSPPGTKSGKVSFKQVVTQPPISWVGIEPEPVTMLGDYMNWTDCTVKVDVYLPSASNSTGERYVAVYGRIETFPTFQDSWLPGYGLQLYPQTGMYQVVKGTTSSNGKKIVIASGNVVMKMDQWYTVDLVMKGNVISGYLDGNLITSKITDSSFKNGLAGVGSGWNEAFFDNFSVQ